MNRPRSHPLAIRKSAEEAAADLPALMAKAEKAVASVLHGNHAQKKVGAGEKFWQFREYAAGDRPQDIDWRQSGKTDEVYIRQKEWQTPQATIFWCSRAASMEFSSAPHIPAKATVAKILTLALGILMTRAGDQVGLFGLPRTGRSEAMLQRIGASLCETPREAKPLPDLSAYTCPRNASIVQIGDFMEPPEDIQTVFRTLAMQNESGLVVQVLDPAEIELPYSGRVVFEDPAHQARETVNHVSSIRDAYRQRIADQLRAVETLCKSHHWDYILHRTDMPIDDTLAALWARLSHHETKAVP